MEKDNRRSQYYQVSELQHVLDSTSMYLGGKLPIDSQEYFYVSEKFIKRDCKVSPAALKVYDEVLVNAIDQATRNSGKCNIWISFDECNITIKNDGSCIPVFETETIDKRKMYNPQLLFGEFRTSGNYNATRKTANVAKGDGVTGGTFGLGIKLTNVFSKNFHLETYDKKTKTLYKQKWSDGMKTVYPPVLQTVDIDIEYTQISFSPNYDEFGMNSLELIHTLRDLAHVRAIHASVFLNSIGTGLVFWNGKQIKTTTLRDMAFGYTQSDAYTEFEIFDPKGLKWHIILAPRHESDGGFESVSIINGIYVKGGTHISHLQNQIINYTKPFVQKMAKTKKINKNHILKYMFIIMRGQILKPEFTGQRKDEINTSQSLFQDYKIPDKFLEQYWLTIKPLFEEELAESAKDDSKRAKRIVKAKKYYPAKKAGTAERFKCGLFIAEGDSALGVIDQAISSRASQQLTYEFYGCYSIQGVPMNPRKEITLQRDRKTGSDVKVRSEKLKKNERLKNLVEILGLDYTRDYTDSAEISKNLNYGRVIIASDQDEDGKGNIRSQIVNFFQTFWPGLIAAGFVCFINTPIVRAFHKSGKKTVQEFYTENAYKSWVANENASDWEIVYYKGLGSHGEEEIKHMFSKWPQIMMTYSTDQKSELACEVYFGKDANKRKIILANPPIYTEDQYYTNGKVSITDHFNTATKAYQIYNIGRHIPHEIDGLTPSKRKVLAGARKKFSKNNDRLKIYQLGGEVAKTMNYHHGDGSLNETITKMAQSFIGARNFPLLKKLSNFGSRKKGGIDAAQPRYGYLKLNKPVTEAMFPRQDDYILDYTFDDGNRGEPVFYVPIVPLAILEHYKSPGHGWASTIWARDYWAVSDHIKHCIKNRGIVTDFVPIDAEETAKSEFDNDFPVSDWNMKHRLVKWKGVLNSVGTYKINKNTIVITELPIRVWNEHYINGNPDDKQSKGIIDDPMIQSVHDSSTETEINIEIKFKNGVIERILTDEKAKDDEVDPILKYLDLKQSLKSNICTIGLSGSVVCHKNYMSVFESWFGVRKRYYELRIDRNSVLLRLKIIRCKNKIRFCEERHEMKINGISEPKQVSILSDKKYQIIDNTLLDKPNFTAVEDLEKLILAGRNSSYDYLLNMTSRDFSTEGIEKLRKALILLEQELAEYMRKDTFPGARLWLSELEKLDSVVDQAREKGWDSWEVRPKWK